MLKCYHDRYDDTNPVNNLFTTTIDASGECETPGDYFVIDGGGCDIKLKNADILSNLESKVSHLEPSQQCKNSADSCVFNDGYCNDNRVINVALTCKKTMYRMSCQV